MNISDYMSYRETKQALAAKREADLEIPTYQRASYCFRCGLELPDWNTDHRCTGAEEEDRALEEQHDYESLVERMYESSLSSIAEGGLA